MKRIITLLIGLIIAKNLLVGAQVNLVTNGNFETGIQGWYPFNNSGTHTFALDASNPLIGSNSVKISITNGTSTGAIGENWRLGSRWRMSLVKQARYLVHFKARASKNLKLVSMFQQNFSPYTTWGYVEWDITTETQNFDVVLNNSVGVGGYWAFVFYYGHLTTGNQIWIDDVKIEELPNESSGLLTDGNICNGDFENNTPNMGGQIAGWKTYLANNEIEMSFEIDSLEPINGKKSIKITNRLPKREFKYIEKVFGFDGQRRYAYCPTVIKENDISHIWFCGNPTQGQFIDYTYYMRINSDGTKTTPVPVLTPGTTGKWDDRHICDPSVIKGEFKMGGINYQYAMFYLGNSKRFYYNEIGVAFANSLTSVNWIKYPNQIVTKTWSTDGDYALTSTMKAWGVGQPSAISLDEKGEVLLTYTIGDINGTRVVWSKLDLSNMDNFARKSYVKMIDNGLLDINFMQKDYTCNAEFAIDKVNNVMVMVRPIQPHPISYPTFLNSSIEVSYIPLTDFMSSTGKWTSLLRLIPEITLFPRNHNACIERNYFGEINSWEQPNIYYTVSKESPEVQSIAGKEAEWTYSIWRGRIVRN